MEEQGQIMDDNQLHALEQQLWKPILFNNQEILPSVYAILDGARDKRIEPMLHNGNLEQACLYKGKISYSLKRAAPHIVALQQGHPLTHKILKMGWGKAWGVFYVCHPSVTLASISNTCRRLTKVTSAQGKTLIFRFYDPRVIRILLSVFNYQEIERIFGPAISLFMEARDSREWVEYSRGNQQLLVNIERQSDVPLQQTRIYKVEQPNRSIQAIQRGQLQLRPIHMAALQQNIDNEECADLCHEFKLTYHTDESAIQNDEKISRKFESIDHFLSECFKLSKHFNIDSHYGILRFFYWNYQYGWEFWKHTKYQAIHALLSSNRDCDFRVDEIDNMFSQQLMDELKG